MKKKGAAAAAKKADRVLGSGVVQSYIHSNGSVGAIVTLSCETDFVAHNEEFKTLARDIAMQITATNPDYLNKSDIPDDAKKTASEVFEKEVSGKPKDLQEKIMSGKLDAYFQDKVLLDQPFIKNPEVTINELIQGAIQKFGEKIEVTKFGRFSV